MDTITAFQKVLDPKDNATGGGTASALAGAMAAGLAAMVARLSVAKGLGEPDQFYLDLSAAGETLARELAAGGVRDAEAFDEVKAAYGLPRGTDEERGRRNEAIQAAMRHAAEVPLENAGLCSRVMAIAGLLDGRSNTNAHSDLQCAGYLARAGLEGCLANVAINLPAIKDQGYVAALQERAAAVREAAGLDRSTEAS